MNLNSWATLCHRLSKDANWWDDAEGWNGPICTDRKLLATKIALIHSETSEMLEGMRKGISDRHLEYRDAEEVECADLLIRIFDYAGARGLDLEGAIQDKLEYNQSRRDHQLDARQGSGGKAF